MKKNYKSDIKIFKTSDYQKASIILSQLPELNKDLIKSRVKSSFICIMMENKEYLHTLYSWYTNRLILICNDLYDMIHDNINLTPNQKMFWYLLLTKNEK